MLSSSLWLIVLLGQRWTATTAWSVQTTTTPLTLIDPKGITTTTRWMSSSSHHDDNDDDITVTKNKDDSGNNDDITSEMAATTPTASTMIPANLRRKIQAKRPTLGHVVPYRYRQEQKNQQRQQQQQQSSQSGGSLPSQLQLQGRRTESHHASKNNYLIQIMAGSARGRKLESPSTVYLRPMMGKVKEAIYSTLTSFGIYDNHSVDRNPRPVRHLDIFAGSGSVGLESLSRGATHCTFVDLSPDCCRCIQRNIDMTGLGTTTTTTTSNTGTANDHATKSTLVCCADAMMALTDPYSIGIPPQTCYQIVTICPPYEEVVYGDLLEAVVGSEAVTEDTIVIMEYPIELLQPPKSQKGPKLPPNPNGAATPTYYGMPHVIHAKDNTAIGIRNRKYGRTVIAFYIVNPTGRYPDASSRPEEFV